MGTIVKRGDSYRAVIRKVGHPTITKSFSKKAMAKVWIAETETAIERRELVHGGVSVGSLMDRYLRELKVAKKLNKDTEKSFRHVAKSTADLYLDELTPDRLIEWRNTHHPNAAPQSVHRYLTRIGSVLSTAEVLWDTIVPWREWRKARKALDKLGVTGKSKPRFRRFEPDELKLIKDNLGTTLPLSDIIDFALDTCLRSAEICRVKWSDIDRVKRTLIVRKRKHPKDKESNDQVIPLLGASLDIIDRQANTHDEIFPYNSKSVEAAWRRARRKAGLSDMKFHDLRHEGISRLFEQGYSIQEVAIVSGHKSWNSLKIYTNLRPESLHRQ